VTTADNVVVAVFEQEDDAREALRVLEERHAEGVIEVQAAAVVARTEDGEFDVLDRVDHRALSGAATGGSVGMLVGAIAGPFGMLLGSGVGALVGSGSDAHRTHEANDTLAELSAAVPAGSTALVAGIAAPDAELVSRELAALGGNLTHRPGGEAQGDAERPRVA
jgi:uncharacterized membrane protein